jgi:LuxR family maltose regulon positive regulatory protein
VAELEARTEGWIAGLQLAALSLTGRSDREGFISSFAGSHRYLADYLLEEVVGHQPKEVRSFLLSTSILDRMCGSLCDAIVGKASGSEEILKGLEQANIFVVALDDEGVWYRYHHLFQDFLLRQLQKTEPESVASLHQVASEWHAAHGLMREAVGHAIRTRDWEYATSIVQRHGITMMMRGEVSTAYEWCEALPEEVIRAHPALCLVQSNALVLGYRRRNRGKIEDRLEQVERAAATLEDKQLARILMGQAATTRTILAAIAQDPSADPREHFALARRALDLLSADDPARGGVTLTIGYAHMALHDARAAAESLEEAKILSLASGSYVSAVEAIFHQARLAHAQGRLRSAEEICQKGKADISAALEYPEQELPAVGCLDIALGCVHLERDRLEEADHALLRGLELAKWGTTPYYQMTAHVALFRLREIQRCSAEAVEQLARLEEMWPDLAFLARALRVQHALQARPEDSAALAEASAWCRTFPAPLAENTLPPGMGPYGAAEAAYLAHLAWVRAQIALGNPQTALSYLERQLGPSRANGLTHRVIEVSLLEALAASTQGDEERIWAALQRALAAAKPEGYLRIFDQGEALKRLLLEAGSRGISRNYVEQILRVIGLPNTAGEGESAASIPAARVVYLDSGEHLTERELEMLRLVAQGASNREVAAKLVITEGTVKSHLNHILRKLDVRNRTEAVARARGLGILDL